MAVRRVSIERVEAAALAKGVELSDNKKNNIVAGFKKFDKDGDGQITKDEMKQIFTGWTDEDLDEMLGAIDVNNDGVVDYREFLDWVMGDAEDEGDNEAKDECIRTLEINPNLADSWQNLGLEGGGAVSGKEMSAVECFAKAVELDPELVKAWFNLGNAGGGVVNGTMMSESDCYERHRSIRAEKRTKAASVVQRFVRACLKASGGWTFNMVTQLVRRRHNEWCKIFDQVGSGKEMLDKASFTTGLNKVHPKYSSSQAHALWEGFVKGTGMEGVDIRGFSDMLEAGLIGGNYFSEYAGMCIEDFEALK